MWWTGHGRKPGAFAFWASVNGHTVDVIAFCHGRIGGNWSFWFQDDAISLLPDGETAQGANGRYGGPVHVYHRDGLPSETHYAEVSALTSAWTAAHRGDHTASAAVICQMVKAEKMARIYPNGQVDTSAAADWLCVYDWRDTEQVRTDPATWKWSGNPIVCWVHDEWARNACYWSHPTLGERELALASRTWQRRFAPTLDILTEEADACDDIVLGEKRYTCFVWYSADTDRKSVREMFRRSCDGWMVERGDGAYVFRCGRLVVSPTVIDDSVLVDLPMLRSGIAKSELINDLQIQFTSYDHNHEVVDTTPWTNEDSIDRRGRKTTVLKLAEVSSNIQARRIGKSVFFGLNAPFRGQLRLDLDRVGSDLFNYRFHRLSTLEGSSAFRDMIVEFQRPEIDYMERTITVDYRSVTEERYALLAGEVGPGPGQIANPTPDEIPVPAFIGSPSFVDGAIRFTLDGPLPNEALTPAIRWWPTGNAAAVSTEDVGLFAGPDDDFYIFSSSITGVVPGPDVLTAQVAYRNGAGTLGDFSDEFLITVV